MLIPVLGVSGLAFAAAALNLAVGLAALALDRSAASSKPSAPSAISAAPARTPSRATHHAGRALWLYAFAGGVALGYEVVSSQAIVQFMSTRAFAFSVMLATYLAGLMIGSALYARRADRIRDPWTTFGFLITAAGLVALLEFAALGPWLPQWQSMAAAPFSGEGSEMVAMSVRFAVAGLSIVFLPTVLLGAAFPVALRLVVDAGHVGRDVGRVVALNTLGGIAGTLLTGFVLVPVLGLVRTLGLLAIAASAIGLLAVLFSRRSTAWGLGGVAGMAAVAPLVAVFTPPDRLAELLTGSRGGTLSFYEESNGGTVAVVEQRAGQPLTACSSRSRRFGRRDAVAALHAAAGAAAAAHPARGTAFGAGHRPGHRHHGRRVAALSDARSARGG